MPAPALRADLLAARIFAAACARLIDDQYAPWEDLAANSIDAARAFMAELEHYNPETGALKHAGLPQDLDPLDLEPAAV